MPVGGTIKSAEVLLSETPDAKAAVRGKKALDGKRWLIGYQEVRNIIQSAMAAAEGVAQTRMLNGGLVFVDGGTQTIAIYELNWTSGQVLLRGAAGTFASGTNQDLLADIDGAWQLDGTAAVAITADGLTLWVALVIIFVNGSLELHAVFGDEAADASEVQVTEAQVLAALEAATITDVDLTAILRVGRVLVQRTAVDTMVITPTAITDDDVLADRQRGSTPTARVPA